MLWREGPPSRDDDVRAERRDAAQDADRGRADVDAAVGDVAHRAGMDRDLVATDPGRGEMGLVGREPQRERK